MLDAIKLARKADPTIQFTVEQPATSEMRKDPRVQACAYGERQSGKKYRLWMSKEAQGAFAPVRPESEQSMCRWCKKGEEHPHAAIPDKGSSKERISLAGFTNAAAKNRVPPALAETVARAQKKVWRTLNGMTD